MANNQYSLYHFKTRSSFETKVINSSGKTYSEAMALTTNPCYYKLCLVSATDTGKPFIYTHGREWDGQMLLGNQIPINNLTVLSGEITANDTISEAIGKILGNFDIVEAKLEEAATTYLAKKDAATVATSGSYNDLSNKPTIPAAVTETTVTNWGFTKNTGTYSKPSTGIPKTDLASAVQTSLGKADTALQSIPSEYVTETELTNKGYATTSAMNTGLSGKVDKVSGKQLSTEDFTTALKNKLNGLSNYNDTEIQNAVSSLQTQINTLVSGDANTAIESFNEIIAFLDGVTDTQTLEGVIASIEQQIAGKQATISDLATIRSGASAGATAVQPSSLAKVATSGSYNDLSNKPTIPSAVTESTVSGWGFTKNTGTYTKPSTGIPKSDLASAVQTSLGKADTAMQALNGNFYGVCDSDADTFAKVVTISGFPSTLTVGQRVTVKFTYASSNTDADNPMTLNVNGTGAYTIYRYGTTLADNGTTTSGWVANSIQNFTFDGTGWMRDYWNNTTYSNVSLGQGYATCSTAESTTAKTASLSSYSLTTGGVVSVKFSNAVPASATLNINSKGAKSIYHKGAAIKAGVIKAGDIATFIYSSRYHLISIDRGMTTVTTSDEGLMSASDKTKLDGIATGATAVSESTVSGWGFTKNTGTYSKPSTGIPKTDLASAVQTSLGKADTALQSYTEQYKGTVTGVKINGTTKNPSSGVVDLGTVITAHQDISGKADKSSLATVATSGSYNDLSNKPTIPSAVTETTVSGWGFTKNSGTITKVQANGTDVASSGTANIPAASTSKYGVTKLSSATNSTSTSLAATASAVKSAYDLANGKQDKLTSGTNIKTINNTSLLGSGNIAISPAYSQVSQGTSNTTATLSPNTFYVWGTVSSLTLTLGTAVSGVANEYLFQFTSGTTATTLSLPSTIKWANDETPTFEANKTYQISILNNLATLLIF